MANVVSLADRAEMWNLSFRKGDFYAYVSSRGRIKLIMNNEVVMMDTIESVDFMGKVSKSYEDEFNVLFSV